MKLLFENWRKYLKEDDDPVMNKEIEELITNKFSFNSLQGKDHHFTPGEPVVDYGPDALKYFDKPTHELNFVAWNTSNPVDRESPDLKIEKRETLEAFLTRVKEAANIQESLYYGTSTIFQEEIAENGIKAPSKWGSYGLAEENAMKIVEKHGGEPAVIQIPLSEFKNEHFLLDESNNDVILYTEDFHISMEKQEKKLV